MTSFLLLTFFTSHAGIVWSFFHPLSTVAFASGIFIACGIGTNLCTKLWCNTEFSPFAAMCSSCILFRHWLYSLSCGFMGFSDTNETGLCFWCLGFFRFWDNGFPNACLRKRSFYMALQLPLVSPTFASHSEWCLLVFFVTRINRINSSQTSGVLKFRFLDCPFLFFYSLSGFSNSCPSVKATYDLDVMSFGFLSVSPQTTYILLESFRSIIWISWNLSTNPTDFGFRRHSNGHQLVFLVLHPNQCELTWWHQRISVE